MLELWAFKPRSMDYEGRYEQSSHVMNTNGISLLANLRHSFRAQMSCRDISATLRATVKIYGAKYAFQRCQKVLAWLAV
jgi:hypothetical protein